MAFTSVASSASDGLILAVNSARKGFIVTNTDANALYLKMDNGAATAASFSAYLAQNESLGVNGYTGELRGIWAGDGSGNANVTEW